MIFTVPLQAGTSLANVVYRWIALGAIGAQTSSGVTQPSASWPMFRIDSTPPTDAEEIIVYDSTDLTNWNAGGYRKGLQAVADAQQVLLSNLYVPSTGPLQIIPAAPTDESLCRVYGTFKDPGAQAAEGVPITFTLVLPDVGDPTIIYSLAGSRVQNSLTKEFISGRIIAATLTAGMLKDSNGNSYLDLIRNNMILPANTKYLITCDALGATHDITFGVSGGPVSTPLIVQLNTDTFDLSTLPSPS